MTEDNPYKSLPADAFWRTGVAEPGLFGLEKLWASKWKLPADARFSTYGSCFAQHISRALVARKIPWVDAEPAPGKTPKPMALRYNYGVYSSRTGNIYTAAQLLYWVNLALEPDRVDAVELWQDGDLVRDSLRPVVEPRGFASEAEARQSLRANAIAFRRSVSDADVFVFTLGLTEGWENAQTQQPYPLCPGTSAGAFDPEQHVFRNYTYPEISEDLSEALSLMWTLNPDLKVLLTVSPVPLTATASGDHVLVATTYSKSTLRAVAGDLSQSLGAVDYFPSYEIIAAPPTRGAFFQPNLRSVAQAGVDFVMGHFFTGLDLSGPARNLENNAEARRAEIEAEMEQEDLVCEEMTLEAFNEA